MTDLTKIDTPFGELDEITRWALIGAQASDKALEFRTVGEWLSRPLSRTEPFNDNTKYRLRGEPVRRVENHVVWRKARAGSAPLQSLVEARAKIEGWQRGTETTITEDDRIVSINWWPSE